MCSSEGVGCLVFRPLLNSLSSHSALLPNLPPASNTSVLTTSGGGGVPSSWAPWLLSQLLCVCLTEYSQNLSSARWPPACPGLLLWPQAPPHSGLSSFLGEVQKDQEECGLGVRRGGSGTLHTSQRDSGHLATDSAPHAVCENNRETRLSDTRKRQQALTSLPRPPASEAPQHR